MTNELIIRRLKGAEIIPYIPDLAELRIDIFKAYPYLYLGNLDYERRYLQTYIECPDSAMVLVFDHDHIVGASTAIPLTRETIEVQQPFLDHKINTQDVFYFGESVLKPAYRGQNIYRHFFRERETAAREYGCKIAAFAAVERPLDDPKKPGDYVPLDSVWQHFGYKKHPELRAFYKWTEIGETTESPKPLIFWLKNL